MIAELLWLAGGAAVAGLVQGISGFAFAMVAMSIWVWGIEPRLAAVLAPGPSGPRRPAFQSRTWAVVMREVGLPGFVAASIFIFILTVGLIYEWKKGALEWE